MTWPTINLDSTAFNIQTTTSSKIISLLFIEVIFPEIATGFSKYFLLASISSVTNFATNSFAVRVYSASSLFKSLLPPFYDFRLI